ncbi:DUF4387 domain-containing protein [Desulfofalx alkaliphila]|uniref:DUF4387 domain-containing protein n=1 Tax=Desulfofalx alkaliphila TaxID=105483 RepID=UPI0004E11294|nr:DUF4387 domain-containing protein [Desulfofalx alkaliphila]
MKEVPITELAKVIRSKNSGPYELTLDIIFKDQEGYRLAMQSNIINEDTIANLYKINKEQIINIVPFPQALAIKATIVRTRSSGALGETDVYGAQQHAPLLKLKVPYYEK